MSVLDKRYGDELTIALRLHEISGERVGEVLAEVESHVAETGEDPRVAFGSPKEYAAKVAAQLDTRSGKPSPLPHTLGAALTGALVYVGGGSLLAGLDGPIVLTRAEIITGTLGLGLVISAIFVLLAGARAVTGGRTYKLVALALAACAIATFFVGRGLDGGHPSVEVPQAAAIAIGVAALVASVVSLARAVKRGRVVRPR
ncbi:hypothetical protein E1286_02860 [Nonomuraea terrae]|uniref:DUF1129 family protein n=1 Tax=Nonomuraea terrae TaxID=2530383 RepID=A0A4R4ZE86_9ACTN|nr:hypothetical protein [Nonomuraea terrae]TDD56270.1 hypothetical protein E1286_02860 [Nonomuraea terrae]